MHPNHTTEEWRDIPGYEGVYQVSSMGRVRSVDRFVTHKNRWGTNTTEHKKEKVLSPGVNTGGYLMVSLFHRERGYTTTMIHTIVAESFIGPRPTDHDIHHKDEWKQNNQVDNLEYKKAFRHTGDHMTGNIPGNAKLTPSDAKDILAMIQLGGISQAAIARRYGVSPALITLIKQGKYWNR